MVWVLCGFLLTFSSSSFSLLLVLLLLLFLFFLPSSFFSSSPTPHLHTSHALTTTCYDVRTSNPHGINYLQRKENVTRGIKGISICHRLLPYFHHHLLNPKKKKKKQAVVSEHIFKSSITSRQSPASPSITVRPTLTSQYSPLHLSLLRCEIRSELSHTYFRRDRNTVGIT